MLGKKIDEHDAQVFLVNTGWTGGEYGVGKPYEAYLIHVQWFVLQLKVN